MGEIEFKKHLKSHKAWIHFADGTSFEGYSNQELINPIWGEAAFTTGMTGYEETATDPSFLGQHIIYSTSHVGNYESNEKVRQSDDCHATALVARNFSPNKFFENIKTPLISDIDTRALVKYLVNNRESHKSAITISPTPPSEEEFKNAQLICNDLKRVSQPEAKVEVAGDNPIVLVNYGCKDAIVKNLKVIGKPCVTVPYNTTAEEISKFNPRMIFLSNGPGDPRDYEDQIKEVKKMLKLNIPIRGICLGHQLISLALGSKIIKLPFGQRGVNHPVLDTVSGEILITSQNHGYSTDEESFLSIAKSNQANKEFIIQHKSLFDRSVEGISSTDHFIKSVQFHPESNPGPSDAHIFFTEIEDYLNDEKQEDISPSKLHELPELKTANKEIPYKKILLIGSGPIKIGQASEFDYSGTQACKSLKEIGIDVILLNSNPATIMTDVEMAHKTYIEPITKETICKIIEKEKVDAVLSTMGGQTALNMCIELEEDGYLSKNNVALLGAKVDTINKTEDRDLFALELDKLGYQTGKRFRARSEEEAKSLAQSKVGFPLIIRRDYALGGKGAALVYSPDELNGVLKSEISYPITLEKSLVGFKEVELEVMVDKEKNGVIICSIENVDPCGIHTGDSITVAPAQTISDRCYQKMRTMSLTIAKHMGVVAGGANVQFAINPHDEDDIIVIEMNPRVSRSSALASKATGYPIAKISALLAVGYTLREILNDITKASPVAFEPTQDYVALKIPIFPFNKFPSSSRELGPSMRSVGEVLAIGGNFTEAFLKALRSLEMGLEVPELSQLKTTPITYGIEYLTERLKSSRELSLLTALEALREGMSVEEIHSLSKITGWFVDQMNLVVEAERIIKEEDIFNAETFKEVKKLGLSDKYIALLKGCTQEEVFKFRKENNIFPVYRAVDTCSGEFNALTPYYYSTYSQNNEAESMSNTNRAIAILGSGPNRIGQGIEFDYSCVKACQRLKEKNIKAIMINSNPETVSTDYDSSDRLYLSPLYSEDLFDIFLNENPEGVISCFSGQTGIKIREHIEESFRNEIKKINFLGSTLETIHLTEDRQRFAEISKQVPLSHTKSKEVIGYKKLINAMSEIGMPVIIRPSYVIGGESMYIFNSLNDIEALPEELLEGLKRSTTGFQIENYLKDALEYDVDLVRDKNGNIAYTICEHIEHAGVHSGDSGMISPPVVLQGSLANKVLEISRKLADILNVIGPINFQYAIKEDRIYCIEANPRGSRTLPFLSKAYNISLPQIATDAMLGESIEELTKSPRGFFTVKQSTFPFDRFLQDSIILGPKMRSTGETLGIDQNLQNAILKSYLGNYPKIQEVGKILLSLANPHKEIIRPYLKQLSDLGYKFTATEGTCHYIRSHGIECEYVAKLDEEGRTILDALKEDNFVLVVNTPLNQGDSKSDGENIRNTAIQYGVPTFTRSENIKAIIQAIIETNSDKMSPCNLQDIHKEISWQ